MIKADAKAEEAKQKERVKEEEEEEAWEKILDTMTVEERVEYLAARQKY